MAVTMRPQAPFEGRIDKRARIMGALDDINRRLGKWTVVTASQGFKRESKLRSPSWTASITEVQAR